jgi:hypothetical protein
MVIAQAISVPHQTSPIAPETTGISRKRLWIGRVLTGISGAFLIMDGSMKLFKPPFVVEATVRLGYPESTIIGIGLVLLICTLLYLIPRTSVLGAVLLTGYLGGAVATNIRAEQPMFNIVFPIIFATIAWAGLWLREPRLGQLLPLNEITRPIGRTN